MAIKVSFDIVLIDGKTFIPEDQILDVIPQKGDEVYISGYSCCVKQVSHIISDDSHTVKLGLYQFGKY